MTCKKVLCKVQWLRKMQNRWDPPWPLRPMQTDATLLGPTCCVRLHGTTTILALVAFCLKPVKHLGPYKRTQHCWSTTRNDVMTCCVGLHGPLRAMLLRVAWTLLFLKRQNWLVYAFVQFLLIRIIQAHIHFTIYKLIKKAFFFFQALISLLTEK